ncbi:hypothetical protein LTR36_002643 [Oleoguttula mirabilis]|uniref:Uncharacterized protein n=1 Tax=Oleoguttula mirabilis TaxID=1507867 RepID=A0AAV9JLC3_9PEZI|nr:hypothetical protein LTR36_002643 [Oleoguttula mirabilis]
MNAANAGVGDLPSGTVCRQCQYAEATAQHAATMSTLTSQQILFRAHTRHLLTQRVSLAAQPFTSSVRRAKRSLASQNAVLEKASQDLVGHIALAKVVFKMRIAAIDAETVDNVMCLQSLD